MANELQSKDEIVQELEGRFQTWDSNQKQKFHRSFLKALEKWSWGTDYKDKKIEEKISFLYLNPKFLDLFLSRAHAVTAQDSYLICNYGGWMSAIDDTGKCLAPWTKSNRSNEILQEFGEFYTGKFSCGKGKFRCNPTVFGGGKDGKGFCVETDDTDPNMATTDCIKNLNERGDKEKLEGLIADPRKAATYISMAAETIRYCNDYEGVATYCDELISKFKNSTSTVMACIEGKSLYSFLPSIVSPLNEKEIDDITSGLASNFKVYQEDLERRQLAALKANEEIIKKGIEQYTKSDKTETMLNTLRKNLTKCIADSCVDRRGLNRNGPKPKGRSVAKCLRYVKYGMLGKDSYLNSYPGTINAVHSGGFLANAGFSNLMDNPSFSQLTPENAPVGAIIVYKKVGAYKGRPGHIEVKGSDTEYLSDFENSEPTRVGGKRIPIGIYVKIPKDLKNELVEVPES